MSEKQAELFKVLGVESRIRIIELLKQRGPLGVIELSEALGITPSAVSQHLKVLKHAGLVSSERKGYWIPYDVDASKLEECAGLLTQVCTCGCQSENCCQSTTAVGDDLESLREYEQRLQKELDEVRVRISSLDAKG